MQSKRIQKLIDLFSQFPTVGPRTASRFVFYLLKQPKEKAQEIIDSILDVKNKVKYCQFCFNPFEPETDEVLCPICKNQNREKSQLCIVEKETDLNTIENTKKYKGLYFILGGTVAVLKENSKEEVRINELAQRMKNPASFGITADFKEVIVATNPTSEGRTTALLVERMIKETLPTNPPKITHLGLGLPIGGELEYADEETLENAFTSRR